MPIGKRKGVSAKGVGATPAGSGSNKIGGSLSKNDYNYIDRAFGITEYVQSMAGNPTGHVATGGVIKDFVDGDTVRRSHTFTGDGTFTISSLSPTFPATVDFMLVGGGGGGGARHGGGGGAGGLISSDPGVPAPRRASAYPVSATSYAITIGQGGGGGFGPSTQTTAAITDGMPGVPSTAFGYIAEGGASGAGYPSSPMSGDSGGSGGGGAHPGGSYGDGNKVVNSGTNAAFTTQGYDGGASNPGGNHQTGGGGGAGGNGGTANDSASGAGGDGLTMQKICPTAIPAANRTFAAGGGGGGINGGAGGSSGIGGAGGPDNDSNGGDAIDHTGSGGGGARTPSSGDGGCGSPGICIVSYEIGLSQDLNSVASGGNISFYTGANPAKVIHTFLASGTFTLPAGVGAKTCQILVVGGGGGGGNRHGGGGGGGGVLHLPTGTVNPGTYSVLVGGGGICENGSRPGNQGTQSSFGPPTSAATPSHLIAKGGGWGGSYPGESGPGGGCGGGGCGQSGCSGGAADQPNPSAFGATSGFAYAGGAGNNGNWPGTPDGRLGGGGGGAGGQGNNAGGHPFGPSSGKGGVGKQIQIAGDPAHNFYWAGGGGGGAWGQAGGTPNGGHPNLFAGDGGLGGGGGGASSQESPNPGYSPWMPARPNCAGLGGGSAISAGGGGTQAGQDITGDHANRGGQGGQGTGGGGGGNGQANYNHWSANLCNGGQGGSGIVIIAYSI